MSIVSVEPRIPSTPLTYHCLLPLVRCPRPLEYHASLEKGMDSINIGRGPVDINNSFFTPYNPAPFTPQHFTLRTKPMFYTNAIDS